MTRTRHLTLHGLQVSQEEQPGRKPFSNLGAEAKKELTSVDLWTFVIDDGPSLDPLLDQLGKEEQEHAGNLRFDEDRHRYLGAHLLLRRVLARHLGLPRADLAFVVNQGGKPALASRFTTPEAPLHFSLAHSSRIALLGVSQLELGVDIEHQRTMHARETVIRRQFSEPEQDFIREAGDQRAAFFAIWCAKEAYIKGLGRGLSHPLPEFSTVPLTRDSTGITDWSQERPRKRWHVEPIDLRQAGYSAALATIHPEPPLQLRNVSLTEIQEGLKPP